MRQPFEGFTYPGWKMIGTDVLYDFPKHQGYTPLNFIVDPIDWSVIAYTGEDENGSPYGTARPQWRVAYPEDPNLPGDKESIMERAYERVKHFINTGDGKDGKGEFTITRAEPYVQHQRVAATGRKGRVLLAGDALHSNNPIGGLGLTSGICDAFCYGNALVRVINDGEDDGLLTNCSESRRWTWINATNVMSVANLKRLQSFEPEDIKKRDEFFKRLNTDENFPAQVRKGMDGLMIDSFEKKVPVQPKYREDLYLACEDVVELFPKSVSIS
jgi:2-polyprenyl-6-methoxyphenol hydroxylase-like FAD-dependent oxidoreductase